MARKLPSFLTRAQKAIRDAPRDELRLVTRAEKLANPEKFSPGGKYLVPKSIEKVGARTAFITQSRFVDWLAGISHGKATKIRATGELPYKTAASAEQAAKAKETRRAIRQVKTLERVSRPESTKNRARHYQVTRPMRDSFSRLRAKKLRGVWLDDGDWHQMIDTARAINDPMLSRLMRS